MRFAGLDLAWSARNRTGAVILGWDGAVGRPVAWDPALGDDDEVLSFTIGGVGEESALIAIDAPLVVPNPTGTRACDRALSAAYRKQEAAAYPVNRARLGPAIRGEALVAQLRRHGFAHSPSVRRRGAVRQVVEVYPHPAMIELFGLGKTLKYKARPNRPTTLRRRELERLRRLLLSLAAYEPALDSGALLSSVRRGILRGRALKAQEDLLDALFCAYIALHLWYWGEAGYRCFGNLETGYILVPVKPGGPVAQPKSAAAVR